MGTLDHGWRVAPSAVKLSPKQVHVWRIDLSSASSACGGTLSADEIARAEKFHFERDRNSFSTTRIALRSILARYISYQSEEIEFVYEENGKPGLAPSQNELSLRFNVSHSGSLAMIAVAQDCQIGVDLQQHLAIPFLEIARRFFSEREYRELTVLPEEDLQDNFFACWTRKEAILKASGKGIGTLLKQFSVTVAHRETPRLLEFHANPNELRRWDLVDVVIHPDYSAAVAFESGPEDLSFWSFG